MIRRDLLAGLAADLFAFGSVMRRPHHA
ncbi:hypothetical protein BKA14_001302 [Actinoplanes abujensis]|uniref:Uncharacterized protein n=1 Tax=Paractinoplanes abujensis TaxID=882441 RepID=A0A7W7CM92_9ACTN|nr:hypothetical protein [Actinoplanes abujensis]